MKRTDDRERRKGLAIPRSALGDRNSRLESVGFVDQTEQRCLTIRSSRDFLSVTWYVRRG